MSKSTELCKNDCPHRRFFNNSEFECKKYNALLEAKIGKLKFGESVQFTSFMDTYKLQDCIKNLPPAPQEKKKRKMRKYYG